MRRGPVRFATAAGVLAAALLFVVGTSIAAASEPAEIPPAEAATAEPVEPAPEPVPEPATAPPPRETPQPPPHPTPEAKPKPAPTPKAKPKPTPTPMAKTKPTPTPKAKPKPKPTPVKPAPRSQGAEGQAPGDPNPVRSDEPPAAPVLPDPGTAGGLPPADGEPGAPAGPPSGSPGPSVPTGQGAPLPGVGPPPSRVQLVVAGATVSGIAALTGWLILGGRRRDRAPVRASRTSGATVTLADPVRLDFEVILNRPGGAPAPRYSGRVPAASAPLWRVEDDRPRWLRRLDEQGPERAPARRSSIPFDEESMPWLAGVSWPVDGGAGPGGDDRN